jgi:lactonase family protein with 7-bladed beta-propeller
VSEFDAAADGELSLKTPATVRTGKEPIAIAVNPDGKSVYVANNHDSTLSQYDIGPGGVLSPDIPATVPTGGGPSGIAVSPDGKSVYVTDFCCDFAVSQCSTGAGDTLIPKTPVTVATHRRTRRQARLRDRLGRQRDPAVRWRQRPGNTRPAEPRRCEHRPDEPSESRSDRRRSVSTAPT